MSKMKRVLKSYVVVLFKIFYSVYSSIKYLKQLSSSVPSISYYKCVNIFSLNIKINMIRLSTFNGYSDWK